MGIDHRPSSQRLRRTAKKLLLIIALVAIAPSLFAACGASEDPLVGTWNAVSATGDRADGTLFHRRSKVEFFEDGTLNVLVHRLSTVVYKDDTLNSQGRSAKWSWVAEDHITIEFSGAAYVLETSFDDDKLIMRDRGFGGDAIVTFERDLSKKRASNLSSDKN